MISLFKREQAYEIVTDKKLKSAKLTFLKKLTKLQYKARLIAAQTVSSADSITVILQSKESTTARDLVVSSVVFHKCIDNLSI